MRSLKLKQIDLISATLTVDSVKGLVITTRQRGKGGVAGAPRAPCAAKMKKKKKKECLLFLVTE
jgi:hypothetical protein